MFFFQNDNNPIVSEDNHIRNVLNAPIHNHTIIVMHQ